MAVVTRSCSYLPSRSSSPLPAFSPRSPQPGVERMFTRGGSGRSSGTNRSVSLREIEDDDGGGKLYVAVGKDVKEGRSNLLWETRNLLAGDLKFFLLHVYQPAERIMTGKIDQLCFSLTSYLILFLLDLIPVSQENMQR